MKLAQRKRGFILLTAVLTIAVLLGFLSLAADVGYVQYIRRVAQTAADAGAIAGTDEILRGLSSNLSNAALSSTSGNGFTNGSANVVVSVNSPPLSGPFAGNAQSVEVIISKSSPTFFAGVVGFNNMTVKARAVATLAGDTSCVYALSLTAQAAVQAQGGSSLSTNCGIQVNSNDPSAAALADGSVTASYIGVNGGYSGNGFSPTPITGVPQVGDPLVYMTQPVPPNTCDHNNLVIANNVTITLNPGTYCGGILVGQGANVTFTSGMYFLRGGGIDTKQSSNVTGTGVTFVQTSGPSNATPMGFLFESQSTVTLKAPNSGTTYGVGVTPGLQGILWFSRGNGNVLNDIQSQTVARLEGAVYMPTEDLLIQGQSQAFANDPNAAAYTVILASTVRVNGSGANFNVRNDYSSLSGGNPVKRAALGE